MSLQLYVRLLGTKSVSLASVIPRQDCTARLAPGYLPPHPTENPAQPIRPLHILLICPRACSQIRYPSAVNACPSCQGCPNPTIFQGLTQCSKYDMDLQFTNTSF